METTPYKDYIYIYIKIERKGRNSKYFADKGGFKLKSWQR